MPKNFATALVVIAIEGACFLWLSDSSDRWFFGLTLVASTVGAVIFYLRVK